MFVSSYAERDECLVNMGFSTYAEYLSSTIWKSIRRKVLEQKGTMCAVCKKPAFEVHHLRYAEDDLRGETLDYLRTICRVCHHSIEFTKTGKKRGIREAFMRFERMVSRGVQGDSDYLYKPRMNKSGRIRKARYSSPEDRATRLAERRSRRIERRGISNRLNQRVLS